jgi:hypothetical protein
MISPQTSARITEATNRLLERAAHLLPHPSELTTAPGYTPFGKMVTPGIRVMLFAGIMYPAFALEILRWINPAKLEPFEAAVYEAMVMNYTDVVDPVGVYLHMRANYPQMEYRGIYTLIDQRDQWNIHEETIDNIIRKNLHAA